LSRVRSVRGIVEVRILLVSIFSYLSTYDLYSPVRNVFDACRSIKRASGRGLGPGNRKFLGPVKWHRDDRRVPFGFVGWMWACSLDALNLY
jgi:hypothetical protein